MMRGYSLPFLTQRCDAALEEGRQAEQVCQSQEGTAQDERKCRQTPCRQTRAALQNSLVARLLEELGHAGWDTVEGFYIWRVIGLFPATLLDSLGSQGRLGDDKRCDPKTQQKKRKSHVIPVPWQPPICGPVSPDQL